MAGTGENCSLTLASYREEGTCTVFIIHSSDSEKQMVFFYLENSASVTVYIYLPSSKCEKNLLATDSTEFGIS